jgi:hypothetical protein
LLIGRHRFQCQAQRCFRGPLGAPRIVGRGLQGRRYHLFGADDAGRERPLTSSLPVGPQAYPERDCCCAAAPSQGRAHARQVASNHPGMPVGARRLAAGRHASDAGSGPGPPHHCSRLQEGRHKMQYGLLCCRCPAPRPGEPPLPQANVQYRGRPCRTSARDLDLLCPTGPLKPRVPPSSGGRTARPRGSQQLAAVRGDAQAQVHHGW